MSSIYRLQYNGLTIEPDTGYTVTRQSGCDGIDVRTSKDVLTGADGGNIWEQKYNMRTIGIEGLIFGETASDYFTLKRAFSNAMAINTNNELVIRVWDSTERSIQAYIKSTPMIVDETGKTNYARYRVEFECPNPFFTDTSPTEYSTGLATGGGFPVPMPVESPVGGVDGNEVTIINSGDVAAYATMQITGTVQNPSVRNTSTGEFFTITGTFVTGDVITVAKTNGNFSVLKNGSSIIDDFSGTFFPIAVGTNIIRFTALEYNSSALLTINYSNHYISL
jgi:hypothetical protein